MRRLKQLDRSEALPVNVIHGSGQVFSARLSLVPFLADNLLIFLCFLRRILPHLSHELFSCELRWMCFRRRRKRLPKRFAS